MTANLSSIKDWYELLFPILGLAVLILGIWWTRPKSSSLIPKEDTPEQENPYEAKLRHLGIVPTEQGVGYAVQGHRLYVEHESRLAALSTWIPVELLSVERKDFREGTPTLISHFKIWNFLYEQWMITKVTASNFTVNVANDSKGKTLNLPDLSLREPVQLASLETTFDLKTPVDREGVVNYLLKAEGKPVWSMFLTLTVQPIGKQGGERIVLKNNGFQWSG